METAHKDVKLLWSVSQVSPHSTETPISDLRLKQNKTPLWLCDLIWGWDEVGSCSPHLSHIEYLHPALQCFNGFRWITKMSQLCFPWYDFLQLFFFFFFFTSFLQSKSRSWDATRQYRGNHHPHSRISKNNEHVQAYVKHGTKCSNADT